MTHTMHIHYFQHNHFEDLGFIGIWAENHNITTSVTRFDLNQELPSPESFDWLVVMGGKMGVNDSDKYPWIDDEIRFISQAIHSGKIVIGVCLGAQMIASALGAVVYKNQEPEMGFFPVTFNQNAQNDPVFRHFPTELSVMHFHFDTFELPEGAVAMAKSTVTPIQAFRYGSNVFALQFHCELTETNAPVFINELASEIIQGTYVQQPPDMLRNIEDCMPNNFIFFRVLDEILYLTPAKI